MTVSLAITHAPTAERNLMLSNLMASLDRQGLAASEVVQNARVVEDPSFRGVWPTTRRAMQWALEQPDRHFLLLPDDSIACRDFIAALPRAIEALPSSPLVFYTGHGYTRQAERDGLTWTRLERCEIGCLALLIPIGLVAEFLAWEPRHFSSEYRHSDVRIEAWAYETQHWIHACDPSLVEHTGANRSLLRHDGHESHHARNFIGRDASALDVDFSLGADAPAVSAAKMPVMYRKVMRDVA